MPSLLLQFITLISSLKIKLYMLSNDITMLKDNRLFFEHGEKH